ncbi:MAG: hypothetical protein DRJ03_15635 [Chloroflexi bacterium]|nr:MAG: hypothetical protein B6I35_10260 [Anaerolineaceae bacterium 4572_32.2]RLC76052.1 MAG: hypothetical protein DRI81_10800 [Chloroflexota bacterium]RLC83935.1 MAG: hypothetical protein DRJ03_15635 [Chloroflexota bacterium]HEY72935.1 hypothetical protein [Thermoflexia bacterium]
MNDILKAFQRRHQEKLEQLQRDEVDEALIDGLQLLIADLRQAGGAVADPAGRGQLRALMRFWGNVVYDHTDAYPDMTLHPLDPGRTPPPEELARRPLPPLIWALVGGAAAIIIAVGLVGLGRLTRPEAAPITATPAPFLSDVAVGAGLDSSGALEAASDIFCTNTAEIAAEFALEGIQPEMEWRWEVKRDGDIVADQPTAPWGRETQRAGVRLLAGGSEGVEPGQYELLVYVGERVVGAHSFRVLDTAPRVFDLQVTDAPRPAEGSTSEGAFEDGVRVFYLSYEYEGLCLGVDASYVLYHEGERVQERVETWSSAPQGETQISFQAPGDLSFSSGDYEAAVIVAGEEQARVRFTIVDPASVEKPPVPAMGDITIALGVQPDGEPIITAPDNVFDWNTKVVYAIFDYVDMSDGLRWSAVWMRNGQEAAREGHFWDIEEDGAEGARWVAHCNELGRVLPGGNYSVTLYIENVAQRTADFRILYYVPQ